MCHLQPPPSTSFSANYQLLLRIEMLTFRGAARTQKIHFNESQRDVYLCDARVGIQPRVGVSSKCVSHQNHISESRRLINDLRFDFSHTTRRVWHTRERGQIFREISKFSKAHTILKACGRINYAKLCLMKSWKKAENIHRAFSGLLSIQTPSIIIICMPHFATRENSAMRSADKKQLDRTQSKCFHMEMNFNCVNSKRFFSPSTNLDAQTARDYVRQSRVEDGLGVLNIWSGL